MNQSGTAVSIQRKRSRPVPAFGIALLGQFAGIYVIDGWFPYEPGGPPRDLPHVLHGLFVLQLVIYVMSHLKQTLKFNVTRLVLLWIAILTIRFIVNGDFQTSMILYLSYYVYWVLIFLAALSLAMRGDLTLRQVAIMATLMNSLFLFRMALYDLAGVWLGNTGVLNEPKGVIADAAYPMLYCILLQLMDTKTPLNKPICLMSAIGVVLSMKRGAFIALVLAALVYGATYAYMNRRSGGVRRVVGIGTAVVVMIGVTIATQASQIADRWNEIQDPNGAGSGRAIFWAIIVDHWLSANIVTKFVGFGPHSTYDLTGSMYLAEIPAHNDWLQMLHEFGIIGAVALAAVGWALVKAAPRVARNCPKLASPYCGVLAVAFCVSLFDLFSYNTETGFFSLLAAMPLAMSATTQTVSENVPANVRKKVALKRRSRKLAPETQGGLNDSFAQ